MAGQTRGHQRRSRGRGEGMSRGQSHRYWLRSQAEMGNQPTGKEGRQQIAGTAASGARRTTGGGDAE